MSLAMSLLFRKCGKGSALVRILCWILLEGYVQDQLMSLRLPLLRCRGAGLMDRQRQSRAEAARAALQKECPCASVVAGCSSAPVFQSAEYCLDPVAPFVSPSVIAHRFATRFPPRDAVTHPLVFQCFQEPVCPRRLTLTSGARRLEDPDPRSTIRRPTSCPAGRQLWPSRSPRVQL